MAAKKNELQKILELAGEFVTKREGVWDHGEWESFLKKVDKIGGVIDDEGKRNLGNILEASKFLFHRSEDAGEPKPAKSKAKAKAKAKPKAVTKKKAAAKK